MGTHTNRLDAKGRVSIPASFRAVLKPTEDGASLVLRVSHKYPCIEGWPVAAFDALSTQLAALDTFSDAQEDLEAVMFADASMMEPDKEGRIVLPASLVAHAGLSDSVLFMGLGKSFQIWEPAAAERRLAEARERARARGLTLPGAPA